jgi:hypothetical protein
MSARKMILTVVVVANFALLGYLVMGTAQPPIFIGDLQAQNRSINVGGYAMTTALVTGSRDGLWVIDNQEKRLIVYVPPSGKKKLEPVAARDLRRDFGEGLAGELVILPGMISGSTGGVYVVDPVGKKLIVYYLKDNDLEILGMRDLGADFTK